MGSGGLIVVDDDTCIVDIARYFLDFTQEESLRQVRPLPRGHRAPGGDPRPHLHRPGGAGRPRPPGATRPRWSRAARSAGSGRRRPTRCSRRSSTSATSSWSTSSTSAAAPSSAATSSCTAIIPGKCTGCQRCVQVCPTGRHHRAALRAAQPRPGQVHQVPLLLRGLPLRRHRRRRHRHRIAGAGCQVEPPIRARRASAAPDHRRPQGLGRRRARPCCAPRSSPASTIPSLCSHKELSPFGGCRLCAVEIEGMRGYPLACSTLAQEGMKVTTDSDDAARDAP